MSQIVIGIGINVVTWVFITAGFEWLEACLKPERIVYVGLAFAIGDWLR